MMTRVGRLEGFVSAVFVFLFFLSAVSFAETVVIPMQYRTAAEALPMVEELLSSQGRAVADPRTNALLVVDDEASVQRVREFLAGFDQQGKQGRVKVRFEETGSSEDQSVAARARVSGGDWTVTAGGQRRRDGVDVRLGERSANRQATSEFTVVVVSGSPAYIVVGQDLLFTERWLDLTRRYARVHETVSIQRIETGFEVRPTFLKDHADIEIIPRISGAGTERGVIRFTEAATRLLAPYGQWVAIAGTSQQSNEVITAILEAGRGERRSVTSISLLVESGR
jgi:type II secretory pathway component GspD/PulD (secretin)